MDINILIFLIVLIKILKFIYNLLRKIYIKIRFYNYIYKNDIETECVICLDMINLNDNVYITECGHRYHLNCIIPWFKEQLTCPLCRFQIIL